jgi:hypothetical protein
MDPFAIGVLVVLEAISVGIIITMWRHHVPENLKKDLQWTVLLLIPVFGPLAWGSFYGPLPGPPKKGRAAGHSRSSAK